ncbi:uncharacterized protein PHALS_12203 [Plasmopara halstedii]|uniref:Uncharacterized protein n=1 Tax=Plasmopara halstedii TaxID=4781 RepID=A0A0P1AKH0_PLAHL|nr:uncharacterized protein PHALS_12203 [Plasmopara halstedii]CEG41889.1 hypothetical protein PHALS_12203 [Plasmopara halstedii]|eukprot:XP_024578258.1 hypothetical protein PHALS_12203 [Plasmopara halstedii]
MRLSAVPTQSLYGAYNIEFPSRYQVVFLLDLLDYAHVTTDSMLMKTSKKSYYRWWVEWWLRKLSPRYLNFLLFIWCILFLALYYLMGY